MHQHPVPTLKMPPQLPLEPWVLLWSQSQNCYHVEPLSRMLDSNLRAFAEDRRMDYVPLLVGTDDLVHELAGKTRHILSARDDARRCVRGVEGPQGVRS